MWWIGHGFSASLMSKTSSFSLYCHPQLNNKFLLKKTNKKTNNNNNDNRRNDEELKLLTSQDWRLQVVTLCGNKTWLKTQKRLTYETCVSCNTFYTLS